MAQEPKTFDPNLISAPAPPLPEDVAPAQGGFDPAKIGLPPEDFGEDAAVGEFFAAARDTTKDGKPIPTADELLKSMGISDERPTGHLIVSDTYIQKAGFNNSLVGLTYQVISGNPAYDVKKFGDPKVWEEVAAIAFGFLLDAPLFMLGGGIGGFVAKKGMGLAARGVVNVGSKRMINLLMKTGKTRAVAEKLVKTGAHKNAKIMGQLAQAAEKGAGAIGSGGVALGNYSAMGEALGQMAHDDRSFSEIEWSFVHREGWIGARLGMMLGAFGLGGKYIESVVRWPGAHQFINTALKGVTKAGIFGAEVTLFAAGDSYLRDEELTPEKWVDFMIMVSGAKLAGATQKLPFMKSTKFTPERAGKGTYDPKFTDMEKRMLEKYRPTAFIGDVFEGIKTKKSILDKVFEDPKIPFLTKSKLIYAVSGNFPIIKPSVSEVTLTSSHGKHLLQVSDRNGMLIDMREFTNKAEAKRIAKSFTDEAVDVGRRIELENMSLKDTDRLMNALTDKNLDFEKVGNAWDTRPEFRTSEQSKLMRKFYQAWDEMLKPEVTEEGKAKEKIGEPVKTREEPAVEPISTEAPKTKADIIMEEEKLKAKVKGGVEKVHEGYRVWDDLLGEKILKEKGEVPKLISDAKAEMKEVEVELKTRDYEKIEGKYRLFSTTYDNKKDFLKAIQTAARDGVIDPEMILSPDMSYGDIPMGDVLRAFEGADIGAGEGFKKPPVRLTSTQELEARKRMLERRIERVEQIQEDLPEVFDVQAPQREALLESTRDFVKTLYSATPERDIKKAITQGKRMTAEQNKNIRSLLEGFLKENRKQFDRLKIPVRTRTMRDINSISQSKYGWRQVGNIIKDLTRMIEDAEYRVEARSQESFRARIIKELRPTIFKKATGAGAGRKRATRSYMGQKPGAEFVKRMDDIGEIVDNTSLEQTGSFDSHMKGIKKYEAELEKIYARADDRLDRLGRGEFLEVEDHLVDSRGMTFEDYKRLKNLEFSEIYDKPSGQLRLLLQDLKDIKKEGRTKAEEIKQKWALEKDNRVARHAAGLTPKGKTLQFGGKATVKHVDPLSAIGVWDGSLKSVLNSLESKREIKEGEEFAPTFMGPLTKEIMTYVTKAEDGAARDRHDYRAQRKEAMGTIFKGLNERGLRNRLLELAYTQKDSPIEYLDQGGKLQHEFMTQRQGLNFWLALQQDGLRDTFLEPMDKKGGGMGWTEKSFDQLDKWLDPELKEYGKWMQEAMQKYKHEKVDPVYAREMGVYLDDILNYWPLHRVPKRGRIHPNDLLDKQSFPRRMSSERHITRVKNTNPLAHMDAIEVFEKYMEDQIDFTNWSEAVRIMDETYRDPLIIQTINQFHGPLYNNTVKWFMDRFSGRAQIDNLNMIDKILGRMSKGTLFLSRMVGWKQTISSMMFMADCDPIHLLNGMARMHGSTSGYELREVLNRHPFLVNRGDAFLNLDMDYSAQRTKEHFQYTENKMQRMGQRARFTFERFTNMIPGLGGGAVDRFTGWTLRTGDRYPIVHAGGSYVFDLIRRDGKTWKGVKAEAKKLAKKQGMEYNDALDQVLDPYLTKWSMLAESTQQSTRISNISRARSGTAGRMVNMFTSGAGQVHRFSIGSLKDSYNAMRQGKYGMAMKHFKNFTVGWALMGTLFTLMENGFRWDDEDQLIGLLMGSARGVAFAGRGLSVLADAVLDKPWADKATLSPIFGTIRDVIMSAKNMQDAYQRGDMEAARKHAKKFIVRGSQLAGIQLRQGIGIVEDVGDIVSGESDAPLRQAMGIYDPLYSPSLEVNEIFNPHARTKAEMEDKATKAAKAGKATRKDVRKLRKDYEPREFYGH